MIEITPDGQLNYEKIVKGDYISEDVLRKVTGYDPRENHETYTLAILKIRSILEKEYNLIPRGEGFALRVLTSTEATYYAVGQARQARRRQRRNLGRLIKLDEAEMDEVTRARHRKHIEHETRFDSAQQQTWKSIRVSQTQERLSQQHQDKPITIVSTRKGTRHGITTDQHSTDGDAPITPAQRPDGQSSTPAGERNEETNRQEKQD